MRVFVRIPNGETVSVEINKDTTINSLRRDLAAKGLLACGDEFLYGGRILSSFDDLSTQGLQQYSTIAITSTLDGGAKKRKKKNYSTPKRIKHKPKRVKLRVLKYYSVQKDGSVKRLRSSCPKCGPGVFLGNHKDRLYCGRCCESTHKAQ